jgi:hypothetical protein
LGHCPASECQSKGRQNPNPHIVHKAVSIVVNSITGNFAGVCPDVAGQIGMGEIKPGINDSDYDSLATVRLPRCGALQSKEAVHILVGLAP